MAFVVNDRVKETSTTTGTGTLSLAGAVSGFQTFVAGIGNSNVTYYAIVNDSGTEFEIGIGTVTDASPDTLSRTTILESSNSDSAVDFSSGTKTVFCTLPASKAVFEDNNNDVTLPDDLILGSDSAVLKFGADSDITLTHAADTGLTVNGTFTATGFIIGSADINEAELETIDGVTAGTVAASKAVVVDSNKDIGSFRNVTLTGELDAATLDISGDVLFGLYSLIKLASLFSKKTLSLSVKPPKDPDGLNMLTALI
jgi:hypothetical protein